jgi:FlaA1/EpsC-like NDP-sugar epimerase
MEQNLDDFSPVKEFFRNKTVFITGGFGFVGKLLIEKFLRCDVKKVFVMARPKKGKNIAERFELLMNEPVRLFTLKFIEIELFNKFIAGL